MTRLCNATTVALILGAFAAGNISATPSTTYWTPCTMDIQPASVTHLGVDDYFRVGTTKDIPQFPTDVGLTWGANLSSTVAAEYGVDLLSPSDDPLFFNAKIGYREKVLSKNAPALQIGFFNFGTRSGVTNQNILYAVIGKTLPDGRTRVSASYYIGNGSVLRSSSGEKENAGYMVALDHQLVPGKWVLAGDYASGRNAIGAGGIGIYYYLTKDISLLAGLVRFNDEGINGDTKWTTQLDVNF